MIEATIAAIGAALVATISGVFTLLDSRGRKKRDKLVSGKIDSIGEQVSNSHNTNLRDDIDRTHFAVERLTDDVKKISEDVTRVVMTQDGMKADMRGMRKDVGRVTDDVRKLFEIDREHTAQTYERLARLEEIERKLREID